MRINLEFRHRRGRDLPRSNREQDFSSRLFERFPEPQGSRFYSRVLTWYKGELHNIRSNQQWWIGRPQHLPLHLHGYRSLHKIWDSLLCAFYPFEAMSHGIARPKYVSDP